MYNLLFLRLEIPKIHISSIFKNTGIGRGRKGAKGLDLLLINCCNLHVSQHVKTTHIVYSNV